MTRVLSGVPVVCLIAGVVLAGCKSTPTAPDPGQVPTASATITDPPAGRSIDTAAITVSGVYSPPGQGLTDHIWILVWPDLAPGVGFPQSSNAGIGEPAVKDAVNSRWSVIATFGGPPQGYDITVYTATAVLRSGRDASPFLSKFRILQVQPGHDQPVQT